MSFVFEYVGMRFDEGEHCLFGRIVSGVIHVNDSIAVPTASGIQVGVVSQFWDTLYDWLGMPFYHAVATDSVSVPFCIRVSGLQPEGELLCPGLACSPESPPHNTLKLTPPAGTD